MARTPEYTRATDRRGAVVFGRGVWQRADDTMNLQPVPRRQSARGRERGEKKRTKKKKRKKDTVGHRKGGGEGREKKKKQCHTHVYARAHTAAHHHSLFIVIVLYNVPYYIYVHTCNIIIITIIIFELNVDKNCRVMYVDCPHGFPAEAARASMETAQTFTPLLSRR